MLALVVPILAALTGVTPSPTLTVAPSRLASTLTEALKKELGPGAVVARGGQAVVHLTRVAGALELKVNAPNGQRLLRRQIRLNGEGERPALRVAVLLLVEVYERLEQRGIRAPKPPPRSASPPPADPDPAPLSPPAAPERPRSEPVHPASPEPAPPEPPPVATATVSAAVTDTATAAVVTLEAAPTSTATTALPATPRPRGLWLSVGAVGAWWARPGTPSVGAQVGAHYQRGQLSAGLRLGVTGLCCDLALPEAGDPSQTRIEANPLHIWGLAEARWAGLNLGPVGLSPVAGLGVEWTRVRATATAFVGDPVQETRSAVGGLLRAGAVAHIGLSARLALELGAGVLLRTPRLVVRLPEPFTSDAGDLDPGLITPWLELGARFAAF